MSKSLSSLEVEPEWCSVVMLSSIAPSNVPIASPADAPVASATEVEAIVESPAEEPIASARTEPAVELSAPEMVDPVESPKIDVAPEELKRGRSKSRSESKPSQPMTAAPTAGARSWIDVLRSRRLRIVATVASVLIVGGLIVLNLKSGTPETGDGVAEMDLSEFNELSSLDEPHIGKPSVAPPRELITDAESASPTDRFPRMTSGPRLPPLGLATHADHEALPEQTTRGVVPASATSTGSRGAVLTGQIEFEASQRPMETSAGPFRSLGRR